MSDPADVYDEKLPPEDFERRLAIALAALDGPEGDDIRDLIAWFKRKYPTPLQRLAYARRKYREAMALRGAAQRGP